MILWCGQWVTESLLQNGGLVGSETQRCRIHVSWKINIIMPRQFMRTLGRARLTIAASASCMRNLQSIDDLRKWKEETIPSRWWKTTCFSFVWSQQRRGYNTARIQQERSWTRHACCIDRPIWSFQTVWRHCFNDWTHLVSTVVLFHNVDKCWYCCLITMLKTAQLVVMLQPCSPWLRCVHSAMPNTCADFQSMATHYTRAPQLMSHTSSLVWLLTLYVLIIYGVISSFMVVYC